MTCDEILAMQPGLELDELIARQLFKIPYHSSFLCDEYSTTWEGMRLVVEAMAAKGWDVLLGGPAGHKTQWDAIFRSPYERKSAEGQTAPHAVCLAALLAMEGQGENQK